MKDATTRNKGIGNLVEYLAHNVNIFPRYAYRMTFVDNHDMNSWNGTPQKNFGAGLETSMVFAAVINGMPLVYNGQEAGLDRSLNFFEKDPIVWKDSPYFGMYQKLFKLKHENHALWNGKWGGEMIRVVNNKQDKVISFYRESLGDAVLPIFNFSGEATSVNLNTKYYKGKYVELFSEKEITITQDQTHFDIKPWQYMVLVKSK